MKGFDAFAGVIRSGGKTRRAAKMVILNATTPTSRASSGVRPRKTRKHTRWWSPGHDSSLDGDAYSSIFFQNVNNSVRAADEFMEAAVENRDRWTKAVRWGQPVKRHNAREMLKQIDTPATLQSRAGTWSSQQTTFPNPAKTITVNAQGRYVRVQLGGTNYLSLAEVQVFGQ